VAIGLLSPVSLIAETYIVGGVGANFPNLEALRTSGILQDGDTIVLNANDSSLQGAFTNTLTFQTNTYNDERKLCQMT